MRDGGLPDALFHTTQHENTHVPAIVNWIDKLKTDDRSQLRAYLAGVQSQQDFPKQKTENQKAADDKKPWPKKTE